MQYKIIDESPWQILSNAMTIGPSSTGYQLQVAADGRNYTTLFTVGAGITRQITNLSSGSYFRMKGNVGEVTVNWVRDCSGGGGGTTYTAGEYISIDQDIISVTGITPDLYLTTADTQDFVTEADVTAATSPIESHLSDVERVTASALTELHQDIVELSGATPDLSAYWTSAQTQDAIDEKTAKYFTKEAPIIVLDQDNINAFFGENSLITLLDITNGIYNDNPFDLDSSNYGDFTIDAANKLFYIENVPAGFYRIGVSANNVEDPTLTFKVLIDGEEIETNTTEGLPYSIDGYMALLTNNGNTYNISNWTLEADAERITFKYNEEDEWFEIEVTYKPTIDEAISAATANMVSSTSVSTIWRGTQAEYDAITTPDASTLYIITNS